LSYKGRQDYYRRAATWRTAILVKVFSWSKKTRRFSVNMQIPRLLYNNSFWILLRVSSIEPNHSRRYITIFS